MNDQSFEQELQDTFLTEAEEMLEDTETVFVQIEADPSDSGKIDKIFRLVHTIKGSSHVAGFSELGQFAHTFETLLGALREKKLAVSPEIVDVLLEGNDCLKSYVAALRQDRSGSIDVSKSAARIKACLPGAAADESPQHAPIQSKINSVSAGQVPETKRSGPVAKESQKPVFLLCDDEPDILNAISEILSDEGYQVITATSAKRALEIFKTQHIDVVFTDLSMPEMSGIDFVKNLRAINLFVPVAFVSGHSSREHLKEYLKMGVSDFIEKPFGPQDIVAVALRTARDSILRSALLNLSKLTFKAYVSTEKILSTVQLPETGRVEKAQLDACMSEMRSVTQQLLVTEREIKATH